MEGVDHILQVRAYPGKAIPVCALPSISWRRNTLQVGSCNAVAWVITTASLTPVTAHPFVKATLEGLQQTLAKPIVKKEPVTVEMLEAVVQDARSSGHLSDLRLATACLMGFAGFLRSDELINLWPCDITIDAEMMSMKIVQSKTDQLQQGHSVVVARTGMSTCPVAMLEQYLLRTSTAADDKIFLFRPFRAPKMVKFKGTRARYPIAAY